MDDDADSYKEVSAFDIAVDLDNHHIASSAVPFRVIGYMEHFVDMEEPD